MLLTADVQEALKLRAEEEGRQALVARRKNTKFPSLVVPKAKGK